MVKKLYRSKKNRKIAGVCGGIAEYFDIDPIIIRLLILILVLSVGSGLIACTTIGGNEMRPTSSCQ